MSELISIRKWAALNDKSGGAGVYASKKLAPGVIDNGKLPSDTPWPFAPRKGGWTKGKARKVSMEITGIYPAAIGNEVT